jgi:peptide chain release factor 3
VLISRLEAEYKVEAVLEGVAVRYRALAPARDAALKSFTEFNRGNLAKDRDGNPVLWRARRGMSAISRTVRNLPDLHFAGREHLPAQVSQI